MLQVIAILFALGSALFVLLVLLAFVAVARKLAGLLVPRSAFVGTTPEKVLYAAGIVAFAFGRTVDELIRVPVRFVLQLVDRTSISLFELLREYAHVVDTEGGFVEILLLEGRGFGASSYLYGEFVNLPWSTLIWVVAAFVFLANSLGSGTSAGPTLSEALARWNRLPEAGRTSAYVALVLFVASYLILSSLAALPWLQAADGDDWRFETELRFRLNDAKTALLEDAIPPMPDGPPDDPVTKLRSIVTSLRENDTDGESESAAARNWVSQLDRSLDEAAGLRTTLQQQYSLASQAMEQQADDLMNMALQRHDRSTDEELSARSRERYVDDLVRWYRYRARSARDELVQRLVNEAMALRYFEYDLARLVPAASAIAVTTASDELPYLPQLSFLDTSWFGSGGAEDVDPPGPQPAYANSVVDTVSWWLVDTGNIQLAIAFGMIGFGLFGSLVSRALTAMGVEGQPLTGASLFDIVLVGVSAALVIFLAVQGGVAVVASGGTDEPNAYAMYLLGFVGAVYGDRIWAAARERLIEGLRNGPGNGDGGAPDGAGEASPARADPESPAAPPER